MGLIRGGSEEQGVGETVSEQLDGLQGFLEHRMNWSVFRFRPMGLLSKGTISGVEYL